MNVTLKQVAALAGCSIPAASAVLHPGRNNTRVGKDLIDRVRAVASQLGYESNYHARAMRSGRSQMIGVVMGRLDATELHEGLWGALLGGVEAEARRLGYDVVIVGAGHRDEDPLLHAARMLNRKQVDALIIPQLVYKDRLADIERLTGPLAVALALQPTRHPHVTFDQEPGLAQAAEHLAGLGHREVLWLGLKVAGQEQVPHRRRIFADQAGRRGLMVRPLWIDHPHAPRHKTDLVALFRQTLGKHLAAHQAPTAILAYNDMAALGVCAALAEHRLKIPGDVSVVGYDDLFAELASPPLTTITLGLAEMGSRCVQLALAGEPATFAVPTRLVIRQSTGPKRQ